MIGIPYTRSTPERAAFDVKITAAAAARNPDGSFKAESYKQIQRDAREELINNSPDVDGFLHKNRQPDMASIARFLRARENPVSVPGHDYRLTPNFGDVVDLINNDPLLNSLAREDLFNKLVRGNQPVTSVLRVLLTPELDKLTFLRLGGNLKEKYSHRSHVSAPKVLPPSEYVAPPDPTYIPVTLLPKREISPLGFTTAQTRALAENFVWTTDPSKYQISKAELALTQGLTELSVKTSTVDGQKQERAIYAHEPEDVFEEIKGKYSLSQEEAERLMSSSIYRVPRLYGIAKAVLEVRGRIPEEASYTKDLIDHTKHHSITLDQTTIHPLDNLSSAGLREVLTRGITADDLVANDVLRAERSHTDNLGGALLAARESNLSFI